jgi:murein DD-endopeptidase MepM/ murein hydrolase activator NlpD
MLGWPLGGEKQTVFYDWALFGAPRDYDGDEIFDDIHEGLDFHARVGDPVLACRDGHVVWASNQRRIGGDSLLGSHIIIEHGDGLITWYGHLSNMLSAVGDVVELGDTIGWAGESGRTTGPHLHLIVQHIGHGLSGYVLPDVVDPLKYLEQVSNGVD